jgi:hypothetical protein
VCRPRLGTFDFLLLSVSIMLGLRSRPLYRHLLSPSPAPIAPLRLLCSLSFSPTHTSSNDPVDAQSERDAWTDAILQATSEGPAGGRAGMPGLMESQLKKLTAIIRKVVKETVALSSVAQPRRAAHIRSWAKERAGVESPPCNI